MHKQACRDSQRYAAMKFSLRCCWAHLSKHHHDHLRFMSVSMHNVRPCLSGHKLPCYIKISHS